MKLSNTKAFTGYAILDLAHKGKLHLNDKVSKYIPGFYMTYNDKNMISLSSNFWGKRVAFLRTLLVRIKPSNMVIQSTI